MYDAAGALVGSASRVSTAPTPDGWVEQTRNDLVIDFGRRSTGNSAANIAPAAITGIGITNQRETTLLWERETSRTLYNAIVWQDRRSAAYCETGSGLLAKPMVRMLRADSATTGLIIDPYFSSTKLAWLLDQRCGSLAHSAATVFWHHKQFLVWHLTKGTHHVPTPPMPAAQLFDIARQSWSDPY